MEGRVRDRGSNAFRESGQSRQFASASPRSRISHPLSHTFSIISPVSHPSHPLPLARITSDWGFNRNSWIELDLRAYTVRGEGGGGTRFGTRVSPLVANPAKMTGSAKRPPPHPPLRVPNSPIMIRVINRREALQIRWTDSTIRNRAARFLIFLPCFVQIDDLHLYEEGRFIKFRKVGGWSRIRRGIFSSSSKMKEGN